MRIKHLYFYIRFDILDSNVFKERNFSQHYSKTIVMESLNCQLINKLSWKINQNLIY